MKSLLNYTNAPILNCSFVELLPLSNLTCDARDWYNAYTLFLRPVYECAVVGLLLHGFQGTPETHLSVRRLKLADKILQIASHLAKCPIYVCFLYGEMQQLLALLLSVSMFSNHWFDHSYIFRSTPVALPVVHPYGISTTPIHISVDC